MIKSNWYRSQTPTTMTAVRKSHQYLSGTHVGMTFFNENYLIFDVILDSIWCDFYYYCFFFNLYGGTKRRVLILQCLPKNKKIEIKIKMKAYQSRYLSIKYTRGLVDLFNIFLFFFVPNKNYIKTRAPQSDLSSESFV